MRELLTGVGVAAGGVMARVVAGPGAGKRVAFEG